jgi:diguanylate cyclase (GGDEF)-like protein
MNDRSGPLGQMQPTPDRQRGPSDFSDFADTRACVTWIGQSRDTARSPDRQLPGGMNWPVPDSAKPWPGYGARSASPPTVRSTEPAVDDADGVAPLFFWDDLMDSVRARLASMAAAHSALAARSNEQARIGDLRAGMMACVSLLDQMNATYSVEVERRRALEIDASNARATVALLRAQQLGGRVTEAHLQGATGSDAPTGLPDRASFIEQCRRVLHRHAERAPALSLLVVVLDGYRVVQQVHGHDTADALLRIVAARLVRSVRAGDRVSSLGGDEFACLLADMPSREQLSQLACKLSDSIAAPICIGTLQLAVHPSIGIASGPGDAGNALELLDCAELARHRAKREGCRFAHYDRAMATTSPATTPAG